MFVEFFSSNNIKVQVLEISVLLGKKAFIQAYLFLPSELTLAKIDMNEEEYSRWGTDDNYIKHFICSKFPILGSVAEAYDEFNQPVILNDMISSDARSVHNEADLQKIQSLQEQLDIQAAKLKKITDMLASNGLI